jgi:tetraacyldisaccharide 4'-kinase
MSHQPPKFWQAAPGSSFRARLLAPLGALYHGEVQRRLQSGQAYKAACPVVCVGNATMGGVGKTPFVAWLGAALLARGYRPTILTRGYGGTAAGPLLVDSSHAPAEVGDEPLMLSADLPVVVAKDRGEGARFAAEAGAEVILMDDGLQNARLHKDLSLLLVDAATLFGNGEVFPAGPLRERPEAAMARAGAMVVMGGEPDAVPQPLVELAGDKPLFTARFEIDRSAVPTGPLLAFCGIGRPERFERSLLQAGANLVGFQTFADHHSFSAAELSRLRSEAEAKNARLVTTAKDHARLAQADRHGITPIAGASKVTRSDELLALIEERL